MTSKCNLNQNYFINSLLTELNKNVSNNNLNLIFKLRKFIKHLLDSNLHENDLILNELEIILNRIQPIDLTHSNDNNYDENNLDENNSVLYFEYSFFKLLKFILSFAFNGNDLSNEYRNTNESNLIELMKYCLNKSIDQYELMQQNKKYYLIKQKLDCDDRHDQLNLIELSRNFRVNILNVMHRFKESYNNLQRSKLDDKIINKRKCSINYYDCMSSLLSIYVDISLDLKSCLNQLIKRSKKKKALELLNFKLKCLTTNLCLNIFYLLDSCVYYICNVILQLSNVNNTNLRYIIPLLKKIMDVRLKNLNRRPNKICRSLYLRMLLIYPRLISMSNYNKICIRDLEFYKKYLYSIEISSNLRSYIINLLNKHTSNFTLKKKISNKIDLTINDDKIRLRKFLLFDLKYEEINLFLEALQNKTMQNNLKLKRNLNSLGVDFFEPNNSDNNYDKNSLILKEENVQIEEINQNVSYEENEISRNNLFNIVESFKNNIDSVDDDMIEYDIVVNKLPIQKMVPEPKELRLVLDRINLSQYKKIGPDCYLIENNKKTIETKNDAESCGLVLQDSNLERKRRLSLSAKKYMVMSLRRPSPNRNNISKLNLFRNIFDEDDQTKKTNQYVMEYNEVTNNLEINKSSNSSPCKVSDCNNSICDSGIYSTSSKFYKLNDLVSVMINEDYFKAEECYSSELEESDLITSTPVKKIQIR